MGRPGGPGPLDPIFDVATSYGSIAVGNSPGTFPVFVTINQGSGQADPAGNVPIIFDVVFSEDVTGFTDSGVTITGTAGAMNPVVVAGVDAAHYTVEVTDGLGLLAGTVIANIPAGVATSIAHGIANFASTSTDNTVTWEANYDWLVVNYVGALFFMQDLEPLGAVDWPTIVEAVAADIAVDANGYGGLYYFDAWWNESPETPIEYDPAMVDHLSPLFFSTLGDLDPASGDPVGGTITVSGGYRYHTFTTTGVDNAFWTYQFAALTCDYIVVGGGGSGGGANFEVAGGGGGAGEVIPVAGVAINGGDFITVGVGADGFGTPSSTTIFRATTAAAGVGGGNLGNVNGYNGVYGGGGSAWSSGGIAVGTGGTGSSGFNGGAGACSGNNADTRGGGGAGAGASGTNGVLAGVAGVGGIGVLWLDGNYYGGGGGGAARVNGGGGAGGLGGGGTGAGSGGNVVGGAATAGTGGGGGGTARASGGSGAGGAGGSGVVVIRYSYPI